MKRLEIQNCYYPPAVSFGATVRCLNLRLIFLVFLAKKPFTLSTVPKICQRTVLCVRHLTS